MFRSNFSVSSNNFIFHNNILPTSKASAAPQPTEAPLVFAKYSKFSIDRE
jgi:hypothetical protein